MDNSILKMRLGLPAKEEKKMRLGLINNYLSHLNKRGILALARKRERTRHVAIHFVSIYLLLGIHFLRFLFLNRRIVRISVHLKFSNQQFEKKNSNFRRKKPTQSVVGS
jgi:hypothetical protein